MKKLYYKLIYISLILIAFLLSGCYVTYTTDPIYEDYTEEVYYHDSSIYFGYHLGYYYYYGIPHYWPWWYYYMYRPATHYHIHTHVHVDCPNESFVYAYRDKKFDNKKEKCTMNSWPSQNYRPQTSRWELPDNKIEYNKNNRFKSDPNQKKYKEWNSLDNQFRTKIYPNRNNNKPIINKSNNNRPIKSNTNKNTNRANKPR